MSTTHTKGPWVFGWSETDGLTGARCAPTVYLDKADLAVDIPVHQGGRPIAWVLSSLPDERAVPDARLIAAAPELLEALKLVTDVYAAMRETLSSKYPADGWSAETMTIDAARAAIAKATGEQA